MKRKIALLQPLIMVLPIMLLCACQAIPRLIDRKANAVYHKDAGPVSPEAKALHATLLIADLHADSLLWNRDLLIDNPQGHVDIPRLIKGNVALQVFTIVSKVPYFINVDENAGDSDMITRLAKIQKWPKDTYKSLLARALYQAQKLHEFEKNSNNRFFIIESARELGEYLGQRQQRKGITAGLLGVEGAQVLEGDPENLEVLYQAGFRLIGLAHFFDNEMAGSAHGKNKGGLSEKGRQLLAAMEKKSMILDLAHASSRTIDDALSVYNGAIVVSHTGVKSVCDNSRNITDEQILQISQKGGIIGIGFFKKAICGETVAEIVRSIRHVVKVAGIRHVALGSDFDGSVKTVFDVQSLVELTEALLQAGFSEEEVGLIMGGNALRVLQEGLQ